MLILRYSPASPFARKVRIAAAVLGLSDRIEVVNTDTMDPADDVRQQNPLGKIPVLVFDNGDTLYDSRVIVDYLDGLAGGGKIIPKGTARLAALKLEALADGIADAALLRVYETRYRPGHEPHAGWMELQSGKVERGLKSLEPGPLPEIDEVPDVGAIALACTLGYFDLRVPGWRENYPNLAAWVDGFEDAVPAFAQTRAP
ncbi:glutathione S-transferase [Terrihabitans sp. B22-R8]|uniref:glutathione S-transferase n=1 Tax=Terrihabitans sp. B22-R8 TaxID=3425128 RepID=UPI00403D0329